MTEAATTSRAAAGMGAIAALSRVVGFGRVVVITSVLGTTYLGNAFQASNSFSNVLFELLAAGALSAVLVPAFVELLEAGDDAEAERVAGSVLGAALVVLGAVTVVGIALAPVLARLLTLGVPDAVAEEQRALVIFLLRVFVPQVLLYAAGAVATGVLYAKRRFAVTVAAPIGNTVVMVALLILFRAVVGAAPGLDLSTGARWLLAAAGTGGVVAFVGMLLLALRRTGFRLRPRFGRPDERVRQVLRHSGWGVVLHTGAGILLGAAIISSSAVEGGVVAYQAAFVFFLAPYAVLAQPIHTAILPELVTEARAEDRVAFRASVRWSLERMALLVLPVSVLMTALALPAMRVVAFGETDAAGTELLAAALAALSIGLFPYGAFLLLSRVSYALGDSRTPGIVSLVTALGGGAAMGAAAALTEGWERIALIGLGHSLAHVLGSAWLLVVLQRRVGGGLWPARLPAVAALAGAAGVGAWAAGERLLDGSSRLVDVLGLAGISVAAVGVVALLFVQLGLTATLTRRVSAAAPGKAPT